jgi:phosphate acyltransferase
MQQRKIIVDCMGGDHAPGEMLAGTAAAKAELGGEYLLVGVRTEMEDAARTRHIDLSGFEIRDAETVIGMDDDPMSVVRSKKNSSMAVALRALRDGEGDAVVSTGNTGALFTGASLLVKRMQGVHRAAIATLLVFEKPFLLLDSGANVTVQPEFLPQFAVMGSAYMKGLFGMEAPRVGLLNNGAEACKGTPTQTEAYRLLSAMPGINFVGNVEPNALPFDVCDVAVTDGFSGNICLKAYEGVSKFILHGLKDIFMTNALTKLSALGIKKPLAAFRKKVDTAEYGGSPILGLCKPVIKAHGSSDARAFAGAIRQAVNLCNSGVLDGLEAEISAGIAEGVED